MIAKIIREFFNMIMIVIMMVMLVSFFYYLMPAMLEFISNYNFQNAPADPTARVFFSAPVGIAALGLAIITIELIALVISLAEDYLSKKK